MIYCTLGYCILASSTPSHTRKSRVARMRSFLLSTSSFAPFRITLRTSFATNRMGSGDPLSRTTDQIRASKNLKKKRKIIAKKKRVKAEKRKRKGKVKKLAALRKSQEPGESSNPLEKEKDATLSSA